MTSCLLNDGQRAVMEADGSVPHDWTDMYAVVSIDTDGTRRILQVDVWENVQHEFADQKIDVDDVAFVILPCRVTVDWTPLTKGQ